MKALLLSTSDLEGGAARSAYRLHKGLQKSDIKSSLLVQNKISDDPSVISHKTHLQKGISKIRPILDNLPLKLYPQKTYDLFSLQWLPTSLLSKIQETSVDVINLHWICKGFVPIEIVPKFKKPIVWTFHDMWAFTGGCHYSYDCDGYTYTCGECPQLMSNQNCDLSRWEWRRKAIAWKKLNLTIVTPSVWMSKCVHSSSLFKNSRVEIIPYGVDTCLYKPADPVFSRQLLGLPQDKKLLLFGALDATSDRRKGFHFLQNALQALSNSIWNGKLELIIFGASYSKSLLNLGFKTHFLGKLSDEISLALTYSAADVFLAPSIQDNLPNTVLEAMACGTPCVAFNIGGMSDMIEHFHNGFLAQPFNIDDFVHGITWVLENLDRHQTIAQNARNKIEADFNIGLQAQRYSKLFHEITKAV